MEALEKRGGTFATHTEHTSAFTTVHIIAAVIGVLGAIAVAVTVVMFCRKRKSKTALKMKVDIERNMIERIPSSTIPAAAAGAVDRFDQFATDFDPTAALNLQPPEPIVQPKMSPMMQQYQLQLKLLQVPTHHRASSSTSSTATTDSQHLPPPPYQP